MRMDIKGIAELAGVSPATVSKVINHKDDRISDRTRERVLDTVRRYHYSPYGSTSSPRTDWQIAVLLRAPVASDSTLDGIIRAVQERGFAPIVFDSFFDPAQEEANIEAIRQAGCAGIIWEPTTEESINQLPRLKQLGVPIITTGIFGGDNSLLQPYFEASYRMTEKLIHLGHTNIGCLYAHGRRTEDFLAGYRSCLFDHGIPYRKDLVFDELGAKSAMAITKRDLTAVVSSHYHRAVEFSNLMETLHFRIPADVSLVSLKNDTSASKVHLKATNISTYTINNSDFGAHIGRQLISSIEGTEAPPSFVQGFHLDNESTVAVPPSAGTKNVVVVGSLHMDNYLRMSELPSNGVTMSSHAPRSYLGGKGANEAVGVTKLGHRVAMIGNVGTDYDANLFFHEFERWGINDSGVRRVENQETGKSFIFLDSKGRSMITIVSGANATLTAEEVHKRAALFDDAACCLVQTEVPLDAVEAACLEARERGLLTILKPSACGPLPKNLLGLVNYLVPDEGELGELIPDAGSVDEKAAKLVAAGVGTVIVTLGAHGCYVRTSNSGKLYTTQERAAVDDAGAGDAFISALASYLLYGYSLDKAVRIANYAAGLSVMRHGVIPSLIDRFALEAAIADGELED